MVHRLRAADTVVDHDAEAVISQPLPFRDLLRHEQQVPERLLVLLRARSRKPAEPVSFFGDHQKVDGGLWRDVAERQAPVVLEDDVRGDLLGDDLVEEGGLAGVCLGGGAVGGSV